jgi:CHASE2 domain-containing sensor protein
MSSLEPRRGSGLSRRQREQRAYRLVVAGGVAGTIAVVSFVLAIVGVLGFGLPVIALVVAVICVILFRRLVGQSR